MANNHKKSSYVLGSINDPNQFDSVIAGLTQCHFYAYIYHDKDKDDNGNLIKKHLHFVARSNPKAFSTWSKLLGIPENMICECYRQRSAVRYLIHLDDKEKAQYDVDNIRSNMPGYVANCMKDFNEQNCSDEFLDLLRVKKGEISITEFLQNYSYEMSKMSFYNRIKLYDMLSNYMKGCL